MTERTTEKQLYFQLKLLILNTKRKYSLDHWDTRFRLVVETEKHGEHPVSKFLKMSEMYETIYTLNNVLEVDNWDNRKTIPLTATQEKFIRDNLHNEKIICVKEQ
jgi:hypothetical protein